MCSRPVILEIPHFASLRNREREIIVLRSDNGEKWSEHTGPTTDDAVREILGDVFDSEGERRHPRIERPSRRLFPFLQDWKTPTSSPRGASLASSPTISPDTSH